MAVYGPDQRVIFTTAELAKHHPWCNRHKEPRQHCKMCEEFYIKYPVCLHMERIYFPETVKKARK